jgi:hypothetical protein
MKEGRKEGRKEERIRTKQQKEEGYQGRSNGAKGGRWIPHEAHEFRC